MHETEETALQSCRRSIVIIKYFGSILWFAACALLFEDKILTWRVVFALPFVLVAIFHLSLAVVQLRGKTLRYRRFLKWRTIDQDEIVAAGAVWPPFIGYMRLNDFLLPWGRLYFVLDCNMNPNPFKPGDYALLRFLINKGVAQGRGRPPSTGTTEDRLLKLKLVTVGLAGAMLSCIWRIALSPARYQSVLYQPSFAGQSALIVAQVKFMHMFANFPTVLILVGSFVLLAVYRRDRPGAWIYALLAGTVVSYFFS